MGSAFKDASSMEGLGHCLADSLLENEFWYVSSKTLSLGRFKLTKIFWDCVQKVSWRRHQTHKKDQLYQSLHALFWNGLG